MIYFRDSFNKVGLYNIQCHIFFIFESVPTVCSPAHECQCLVLSWGICLEAAEENNLSLFTIFMQLRVTYTGYSTMTSGTTAPQQSVVFV